MGCKQGYKSVARSFRGGESGEGQGMCENVNWCQRNVLHGSTTMSTGYMNNEHTQFVRSLGKPPYNLLLNIINLHVVLTTLKSVILCSAFSNKIFLCRIHICDIQLVEAITYLIAFPNCHPNNNKSFNYTAQNNLRI